MSSTSKSDLQSFQDLAQRFAKKELEPKAIELDNYPYSDFNEGALKAAMEVGLLQVLMPEVHGGTGQGMAVFCEIISSLARTDASFASVVLVNSLAQSALVKWGSQALVEEYIQSALIAFPAYNLPTDLPRDLAAEKKGNGYSLKGKVEYLTLAPVADAMILPVLIKGNEQVAFFLVNASATGVSISEPVLSLGLRNCPVADLEFDSVEVSAENLLCADAETDYPALAASFRPVVAALAVGVLNGSYEAAKAYARERYQGGCMIVDYDQVRLMLVNMAVLAECGKSLVQSMAQAADEESPWPLSDAGLILLTEQASRATTDGVQVLGGYGYIEDYGQEKRMRDAKQIEGIFGAAPAKRLELMADILRQEE